MGRRFAEKAGVFRPVRDGRAGLRSDVTTPYRQLLGNSLIALWDARLGVNLVGGEVDTWTDQIRSLVCSAPSSAERPTYLVDGANFKGLPVVGLVSASNKRVAMLSVPPGSIPAGSTPELFVVGRLPAFGSGPRWFTRVTDAGVTSGAIGLLMVSGTLYAELGGVNVTAAFSDTTPHLFESLFDTSARMLAVDGATLATGAAGSTSVPAEIVAIGSNASAPQYVQDANLAMVALVNPAPSARVRSQLAALSMMDWGTPPSLNPPLPANAVAAWHSEISCTPTAWVDMVGGRSLAGTGTPTVGVDAGFFNGHSVAQGTRSPGARWKATGLAAMAGAGTRPWMFVIGRGRNPSLTSVAEYFATIGGGAIDDMSILHGTGPDYRASINASAAAATIHPTPPDANVHRFKIWSDGLNRNFAVDDVVRMVADTSALARSMTAAGIPLNLASTATSDMSIALVMFCTSRPTAAEEAALDAWAKAYYGLP